MENQQQPDNQQEEFKQKVVYYLGRIRVRIRFYVRKVLPAVTKERVAEVQVELRDSSEPDFDYYVLVLLSCMIATFGLLNDSLAIIIGAMLVAPLMSPILGIGLASIRGDTKLLRDAATALGRGALLAVLLSIIITWFNDLLPFVSLQDLPEEVLSRTRPSPIDLGVALAGGLAATFALVQPQLSAALPGVAIATALMPPLCTIGVGIALRNWEVASGALLLFITNAVTIAAASIILFYVMGFSLGRRDDGKLIKRSLQISVILTIFLLAPLGWQSYIFVQEATLSRTINEVVREEVINVGGTLDELSWKEEQDESLEIEITILVGEQLNYGKSVELQDAIAARLQRTVALKINQVPVAFLDPLIPPTLTPTATLGPSPTVTKTPTVTNTSTPRATATFTSTFTLTPSPTPTPALAMLQRASNLRAFPEGPIIGYLAYGDQVRVLYGYEIVNGWVWIEVQDEEGRVGWIPQFHTMLITETPTKTPIPSITPIPSETPVPEATFTPEVTPSPTP